MFDHAIKRSREEEEEENYYDEYDEYDEYEEYDEYDEYDAYDEFDENEEYREEEEEEKEEASYMRRQKGRIYGETTDEFGFPLDGTDYQAHIRDAGPGIFIAPGGEVRTIEAVLFARLLNRRRICIWTKRFCLPSCEASNSPKR